MEKLQQAGATIQRLSKDMPQAVSSFMAFIEAAEQPGALEAKTKHLMLLSLAVAFQCGWCIAVHVKDCVDAKATKEEILEAAMMAVIMGGGPKMMYIEIVYEELDKYFS